MQIPVTFLSQKEKGLHVIPCRPQ